MHVNRFGICTAVWQKEKEFKDLFFFKTNKLLWTKTSGKWLVSIPQSCHKTSWHELPRVHESVAHHTSQHRWCNCEHPFLHVSNNCQTANTHCYNKHLSNCKHQFLHKTAIKLQTPISTCIKQLSKCKHPFLHMYQMTVKLQTPISTCINYQTANAHFCMYQVFSLALKPSHIYII